jgi:argininosuccinate synthase
MEADPTQAYDQGDATGFIRLNALRLKVASKVAAKVVAGGKKPPVKKRK